jgi:hypothetical protein
MPHWDEEEPWGTWKWFTVLYCPFKVDRELTWLCGEYGDDARIALCEPHNEPECKMPRSTQDIINFRL